MSETGGQRSVPFASAVLFVSLCLRGRKKVKGKASQLPGLTEVGSSYALPYALCSMRCNAMPYAFCPFLDRGFSHGPAARAPATASTSRPVKLIVIIARLFASWKSISAAF